MLSGDHILAKCTQIFAEHELSSFVDLMDFCDSVYMDCVRIGIENVSESEIFGNSFCFVFRFLCVCDFPTRKRALPQIQAKFQ